MILYYVRHGDPTYKPDALTPLGRRQAEAVGRRIARHGIDRIYSSTSTRAYQTALPLSEITKKEIVQLDWCHESLAFADMVIQDETGRRWWMNDYPPIRQLLSQEKVRRLGNEWYEAPGLEQYRDRFKAGVERINRHVDEFMKALGYEHDREAGVYHEEKQCNERVALFAHAGFGRLFLSSVLGVSYADFAVHSDMSHTGVTVIEFRAYDDGVCIPRMLTYSNDAHLYGDDLPTDYNFRVRL